MTNQNSSTMPLEEALSPLLDGKIDLKSARILLSEMFTTAVSHAPDDEIDNFTAKRLTPLYLALLQTLENLDLTEK